MNQESYLELFLTEPDLPGMSQVQDSRTRGADPGDAAYMECKGEGSGLAAWEGPMGATVWRLVDIRWVFPSDAQAATYHQATLLTNAENEEAVPNAPGAGSECFVFGGTRQDPLMGLKITHYYYIFRVGRVVAKLYVAQGDADDGASQLTPAAVKAIADKIVVRVSSVLGPASGAGRS